MIRFVAFLLSLAFITSAANAENLKIVASIPPVESIVSAVVGDHGDVNTLVDNGASPHTFTLRPSKAQILQEADAVFWIGPELESFLVKPLAALSDKSRSVALFDVDGIIHRTPKAGDDGHGHDEDHAHDGDDPHIWLDPQNAIAMANSVAETLSELAPEHASDFTANSQIFAELVSTLQSDIAEVLKPYAGVPLLTFHGGYVHFAARFNLGEPSAINLNPEIAPSAKHMLELRDEIAHENIKCIFAEPQFDEQAVTSMAAELGLKAAVLDPLGSADDAASGGYAALLTRLAEEIAGCFSR